MIFVLLGMLFQAQNPVGMVLQVDGSATIRHENASRPARTADLLFAGDRLQTAAGGKAVVEYCPTNQKLSVNSASEVAFAAGSFQAAKGSAPAATALRCMLPQVALGSESLEHIGAMRGRGDPPIALYTGGNLTTARPVFKWEPVEGVKRYKLVITDENDDTIWSGERSAPLAEWPMDASATLKTGTDYRWELVAEADGKVLGRQATAFVLKPNADFSTVPTDPALRLQRAIALENSGYFGEAADVFRQMRAAEPGDNRLTNHLVWLYWNARLIEASNRELARLGR